MPRLGEFKPQHSSNTAWAFATAEHKAPSLFDALASESVANPCAFATPAGHLEHGVGLRAKAPVTRRRRLFDALAVQAVRRCSATPGAAGALEHDVGVCDGGALAAGPVRAVAAEARRRGVSEFKPQDLSNTAWRLRRSRTHRPLFAAIASRGGRPAGRHNEQELTNLAWACAVANAHDADLVAGLRRRLERGGLDFSDADLTQLHLVQLWCERERGLPDAAQPLPSALRERCRTAMAAADAATQRVSDFQRNVGASLQAGRGGGGGAHHGGRSLSRLRAGRRADRDRGRRAAALCGAWRRRRAE